MPITGVLGTHLLRTLAAMGTVLSVELHDVPPSLDALQASEAAFTAVAQAEQRLSTWKKDSELSLLNQAIAGGASPTLKRDLEFAERCRKLTDGAFDPGLGALIQAWRIRSGKPERPAPEALRSALQASRTPHAPGFLYEEGGFAKGIALDDATARLKLFGVRKATLNFGGQILAVANQENITNIRVSHPANRALDVLSLQLVGSGSVATSGNAERGSHILDPTTGEMLPGWGSVTAVASVGAWADCLSTALFVMGPERALQWQARHPEFQVLAVRPSQNKKEKRIMASASCGLKGKLRALSPDVSIEFHCQSDPPTASNPEKGNHP